MRKLLVITLAILCLASCIKNDIPYPHLEGVIEEMSVYSQKAVKIDPTARTVHFTLYDTCDLAKVRPLAITLSEGATLAEKLPVALDLSEPYVLDVNTYPRQTYHWTITADAPVERYFNIENQLDEAVFNEYQRSVMVKVLASEDIRNIKVLDAKLGPIGSTISPDPRTIKDYSSIVKFDVTYRGGTEQWGVSIVPKEAYVTTLEADGWACLAYLYGTYHSSLGIPSFKYREKGTEEWMSCSQVETTGNKFSAYVKGLKPSTTYEYAALATSGSGSVVAGEILEFTTEPDAQMPNMNFDEWVKSPSGVWFPNASMDSQWWDSGNTATMNFNENATTPEEDFVISGKAVHMKTIKVLVALAGGNVFNGRFVQMQGVGAQVDFGQPWETRPTQLTGYYQYTPKVISGAKGEWAGYNGRNDRLHIFVVLADWDKPFRVDTGANPQIHIDPADPHVIAYASLVDSVGTGPNYKRFALDIPYRDHRKPKICAVVACGSEFADYLVGAKDTEGYVDEFEFVYNTDPVWEEK